MQTRLDIPADGSVLPLPSLGGLAATVARPRWIRSAAWDLVWIQTAVWLAPLLLFLASDGAEIRNGPIDTLFFVFAVPLWFGHRFASAWLAYATPGYRPLLKTQRMRFVFAPVAVAVGCFALLLAPESVLPVPVTERVVWLAIMDYVFVSHHFAAQHFGVLSLYRSRAGRAADPSARRLDRWFAMLVGGGFVVIAEALTGSISVQERWIDPLLGSIGSDVLARVLHDGGITVVVLLTALMLRAELRSSSPSLPRVAYVCGLAAMVLFAFLARDPFLFIVIWSVQHWTVAMGLTSLAASGAAPSDERGRSAVQRGALAFINGRGWRVLLVLAIVSLLALPVLEVEAVTDEYVYADRIFGELAWWLRTAPFLPALLALGFATGFSHYILDRATFRFSSPEVREAGRGLLQRR